MATARRRVYFKKRMPPFYHDPVTDDAMLQIADWLKKELHAKTGKKIKIARVLPFLCDHSSLTSILLGFLLLRDRERFDVKGYTTETLEDQHWGTGLAGYSARLGPKAIKKILERPTGAHYVLAGANPGIDLQELLSTTVGL